MRAKKKNKAEHEGSLTDRIMRQKVSIDLFVSDSIENSAHPDSFYIPTMLGGRRL